MPPLEVNHTPLLVVVRAQAYNLVGLSFWTSLSALTDHLRTNVVNTSLILLLNILVIDFNTTALGIQLTLFSNTVSLLSNLHCIRGITPKRAVGSSPPLSAWAAQLQSDVAAVASRW